MIIFRKKSFFPSFFFLFAGKHPNFGGKVLTRLENCNLGVQENTLMKIILLKRSTFFIILILWAKNISDQGRKKSAGLSELQSTCQRKVLKNNSSVKKNNHRFRTLSEDCSDFWQKTSTALSKMHFASSDERFEKLFWKNYVFFYHLRSLSKNSTKFWWQNCGSFVRNSFYMSRGTLRGKNDFLNHSEGSATRTKDVLTIMA